MSAKNKDDKNRWRSETIAFRLSKPEREQLEKRYKLSGYGTKQDFIIDSLFKQNVIAHETPIMITTFRKELNLILNELERINDINKVDEEFFTPIIRMLEILEAFYSAK